MKKENVKFKWVIYGREYSKVVEKDAFEEIMKGLKHGFFDNNEISSFFCDIMPELKAIFIDYDRNNQIEVPFVICQIANKKKAVNIRRCNKIIWAVLNGYCKN